MVKRKCYVGKQGWQVVAQEALRENTIENGDRMNKKRDLEK